MISDFHLWSRFSRSFGRKCFSCFLEGMTEGPMSDVVKQGGEQGDFRPSFIEVTLNAVQFDLTSDDPDETSGIVEHPYRMRKSRMSGGWKNELGNAKLLDTAKALHVDGVEQRPNAFVDQALVVKDDQAMNGISDTLGLHFGTNVEHLFPGVEDVPKSACW
jgi:hypothetical protein